MNYFLYILECMANTFVQGDNTPLKTTGEPMTYTDCAVGLLGCFIVVLIILFIRFLLLRRIKGNVGEEKKQKRRKEKTK